MLRAGEYFPPSRRIRSWSPSDCALGNQERLALVMSVLPAAVMTEESQGNITRKFSLTDWKSV